MPDSSRKPDSTVLLALLEQATVSAWVIDEDETILFANPAASRISGYTADELIGKPISCLMDEELRANHADYLHEFIVRGGTSSILGQSREFEIRRRDGSTMPIELKAFALPDRLDGKRLFGAFISDNSAHKNAEVEMARMARMDSLTQCLNRFGFMERARQEISRAGRHGSPLSLIVMDVDRFKRINDTYGHQVGDRVLAELVRVVGDALRPHDVLGRVGGEEFFVLLPETDVGEAAAVAERLRQTLAGHEFDTGRRPITVTASFGCAGLNLEDGLDRLIQRADRRMYLAKNAGRNRVVDSEGESPMFRVSNSV